MADMNLRAGRRRDASQPVTKRVVAATNLGVWVFSFVLAFTTYTFYNDHFGRLSPAWEIVRYGELPFRDFFDPGFVLTDFASAAVQRLIGDNLLGEILLTSAAIAAGTVCVLLLVHRLTQSMPLALAAAVAVVAGIFRYDNGMFIAASGLAVVAATHIHDRRLLLRRAALFASLAPSWPLLWLRLSRVPPTGGRPS